MTTAQFIPLLLLTLALGFVSFSRMKNKAGWLVAAFIIWLLTFLWTIKAFE